jgi:hypothetical protein
MGSKPIIDLLKYLGLEGFPLFLAAAGVSIVILSLAYVMGTWGMRQKTEVIHEEIEEKGTGRKAKIPS